MARMDCAPLCRIVRCLAAAALAVQWPALAAQPVPEYKMKAAFVYNFVLFTDWPSGVLAEGASFNICINPDSALRPALAGLAGKVIKGRRVALQPWQEGEALRHCHVLYLDSLDRDRWRQIKKELGAASVLTVSDDDEIGHDGAVIALYLDNRRIGFDIDIGAARQAGLLLSSKLLRLARVAQ